jgi:hypothetical protein
MHKKVSTGGKLNKNPSFTEDQASANFPSSKLSPRSPYKERPDRISNTIKQRNSNVSQMPHPIQKEVSFNKNQRNSMMMLQVPNTSIKDKTGFSPNHQVLTNKIDPIEAKQSIVPDSTKNKDHVDF